MWYRSPPPPVFSFYSPYKILPSLQSFSFAVSTWAAHLHCCILHIRRQRMRSQERDKPHVSREEREGETRGSQKQFCGVSNYCNTGIWWIVFSQAGLTRITVAPSLRCKFWCVLQIAVNTFSAHKKLFHMNFTRLHLFFSNSLVNFSYRHLLLSCEPNMPCLHTCVVALHY